MDLYHSFELSLKLIPIFFLSLQRRPTSSPKINKGGPKEWEKKTLLCNAALEVNLLATWKVKILLFYSVVLLFCCFVVKWLLGGCRTVVIRSLYWMECVSRQKKTFIQGFSGQLPRGQIFNSTSQPGIYSAWQSVHCILFFPPPTRITNETR